MSKDFGIDNIGRSPVFELRGHLVMLAADVSKIFNVETRIIVQNIITIEEGVLSKLRMLKVISPIMTMMKRVD